MTINDVAEQLFELSKDKYFDGRKLSKTALKKEIRGAFKSGLVDRIGGEYVVETLMDDGWWYAVVYRFDSGAHGYDYYTERPRTGFKRRH